MSTHEDVQLDVAGRIVWHSSDEDGGPDVGRSLGLGNRRYLWIGEISKRLHEGAGADAEALGADAGSWIVLFDENKPMGEQATVIGKAIDNYVGEEFFTALSALIAQEASDV